MTSFFAELL